MDSLEILVKRFESDPAAYGTAMRTLFHGNCENFLESALPLLRAPSASMGFQYLLTLLTSSGCAVPLLSDPTLLTVAQAAAVARQLGALDPLFCTKLARALPEEPSGSGDSRLSPLVARLIELIGALQEGRQPLPVAVALLRHPNRHVRSKAALVIGRVRRSYAWVDQRLSDPDPRVRANAVESLWDNSTEGARAIFLAAIADTDNRVAGNAIVGLYRLGDAASIGLAAALGTSPDPRRRATGAWIMGRTGDARFVSLLGQMVTDKDPHARRNVFRALAALKAAREGHPDAECLHVTALPQTIPGAPILTVRVEDRGGARLHGLLPTAFALTAHGMPVLQYDVQERNPWDGPAYEIHWEPPDPQNAWPVRICVLGEACRGALTLGCAKDT
ncbi:MAG: HEAT repeat domain-containing protein [Bryobacteraceae bacterium]|jgi:hypothetical protein